MSTPAIAVAANTTKPATGVAPNSTSVTSNSATTTAPSAVVSPVTQTSVGPLPDHKTVCVSFIANWNHEELKTSLTAATLYVVFGPQDSKHVVYDPFDLKPVKGGLSFAFNVAVTKEPLQKINKEKIFTQHARAPLWQERLNPFHENGIAKELIQIDSEDDLKLRPRSFCLRFAQRENLNNLLLWNAGDENNNIGYFNLVQGNTYYLNFTFSAGSMIANKVQSEKWYPQIYLLTKDGQQNKFKLNRMVQPYTNWIEQGFEPDLDVKEIEEAGTFQKNRNDKLQVEKEKTQEQARLIANSNANVMANINAAAIVAKNVVSASIDPKLAADSALAKAAALAKDLKSVANTNTAIAETSYKELTEALNSLPIYQIQLPELPEGYEPDISLDSSVERFLQPGESTLGDALFHLENFARAVVATGDIKVTEATKNKPHPLYDIAKHLMNAFSAISQLPGWLHVQKYIQNPQTYIERLKGNPNDKDKVIPVDDDNPKANGNIKEKEQDKPTENNKDNAAKAPCKLATDKNGVIDQLQEKGKKLLKRLYQRIDWTINLAREAGAAQHEPEILLKVIAADRAWTEEANAFMKESEVTVSEMLTKNPQKFHAFRELQSKGVQWPHAPIVRTDIERAGFVFRPMMIKRDRCVCEICGIELYGFRNYQRPYSYHNVAKHPPSFKAEPISAAVIIPNTVSANAYDKNVKSKVIGGRHNYFNTNAANPNPQKIEAAKSTQNQKQN